MPYALPPAVVSQASPSDYRLPSGTIARERALWLARQRPAARKRAPCPEAKDGEIVVCAVREDDPARDRLGPPLPDAPTAMEVLSQKMHVKLGSAEVHPTSGVSPGMDPAPYVGASVGIKF